MRSARKLLPLLLLAIAPGPLSAAEGVWGPETVHVHGHDDPTSDYGQTTAEGGSLASDGAGTVLVGSGLASTGYSGQQQYYPGGWSTHVSALRPGGTNSVISLSAQIPAPPVVAHGNGTQWGLVARSGGGIDPLLNFASFTLQATSPTLGALLPLGNGSLPILESDGQGRWVVAATRTAIAVSPQPLFSRSTDNGTTFSAFAPLPLPAGQGGATVCDLKSDGDSTWIALEQTTSSQVFALRSADQGQTWSAPAFLGTAKGLPWSTNIPSLATDRRGTWMAAWCFTQDGTSSITLSRSTDNGLSWSAPSVVAAPATILDGPGVATDGRDHWMMVWPGGHAVSPNAGLTWQVSASSQKGERIVSDGMGHWIASANWVQSSILSSAKDTYVSTWQMDLFLPLSRVADWKAFE